MKNKHVMPSPTGEAEERYGPSLLSGAPREVDWVLALSDRLEPERVNPMGFRRGLLLRGRERLE